MAEGPAFVPGAWQLTVSAARAVNCRCLHSWPPGRARGQQAGPGDLIAIPTVATGALN